MSLVYALVARQQNVLCEYADQSSSGNFPTITRAVLKHLAEQEAAGSAIQPRSVSPYNEFNFFFLNDKGLTYLCMAEETVQANVAFMMLVELKDAFVAKYGDKGKTAIAYAMAAFSSEIGTLVKKYDNYRVDTPLTQVRQKMERVKMVMIDNINQLMERGEKIDLLVVRTDKLKQESMKYDHLARDVKRMYCWKNFKYMFILIICVGLLGFILTFLVCGIDFSSCGRRIENKIKKFADDQIKKLDNFKDDQLDKLNHFKDDTQNKVKGIQDSVVNGANDGLNRVGNTLDSTHVS
ncbi:TPA: hypothetical protein N0F65_003081 [Lagenidium giganteum]|uniref:Uncharacterized protein n=1 Tax=Lagenidium giganteum TaxID=4803 RepID=A0AAV2YN73_9STRA|nr:TPA: hypothetical protein N0F65_003081 [Lagenidium giganteum]